MQTFRIPIRFKSFNNSWMSKFYVKVSGYTCVTFLRCEGSRKFYLNLLQWSQTCSVTEGTFLAACLLCANVWTKQAIVQLWASKSVFDFKTTKLGEIFEFYSAKWLFFVAVCGLMNYCPRRDQSYMYQMRYRNETFCNKIWPIIATWVEAKEDSRKGVARVSMIKHPPQTRNTIV